MEVFPDSGFRPWRAIPRTMCFTFASGCSADVRMSLSFIRRTRDQSVLDALEEDSRLTFCCLTELAARGCVTGYLFGCHVIQNALGQLPDPSANSTAAPRDHDDLAQRRRVHQSA